MAGFTLSAEEIRLAPTAVRQWIEGAIAASLSASTEAQQESIGHSGELAACTTEEALQIFQLIQQDVAATLVFLELAHEPIGTTSAFLNAFDIDEIIRHTRLTAPVVAQSLITINKIFQQVRKDPEAMLFGFDQTDHVYIHATTHRSILALWQGLIQMAAAPIAAATPPVDTPPAESPPQAAQEQVGPSDNVTAHSKP